MIFVISLCSFIRACAQVTGSVLFELHCLTVVDFMAFFWVAKMSDLKCHPKTHPIHIRSQTNTHGHYLCSVKFVYK